MNKELKEVEPKILTNQEVLVEALIEHSPDPILIIDLNGNIHFTTPKTLQALELRSEQLEKQPIFKLLPEEAATQLMAVVTEVLKSGQPSKCFDLSIQLPSGEERIFAVNVLPIPDSKDQVVIIAKDTTKYHRAAMEFWGDAWHEVKKYLTRIYAYPDVLLDILEQGDFEGKIPDFKKAFMVMADCARKITDIIVNLALLSETFGKKVMKVPVPMGEVVDKALQDLSAQIEQKNVEIIQPTEWPTVEGVNEWLRIVWMNYISNAIKYGGKPPRVELGATQNEDYTVTFWVQDNGPGLSSKQQEQLFKRYTRLTQGDIEGTGLGLSIVHRVVTRLGGEVGVQSELGKGSRFYFTLPAVPKAAE